MRFSLLVLVALFGSIKATSNHVLKFNQNGKFKMVQFTDIHFGESNEYDLKNQALIK